MPNESAFQKTVDALYDPSSPTYHHWLSDADIERFAPTQQQLEAVKKQLVNNGLTILSTDENGFSIRARGATANVERAFNIQIHEFQRNGKTFRTHVQSAQLSGAAASYVSSVAGLESHEVHPLLKRATNFKTNQPFPSVALSTVEANGGLSSLIHQPDTLRAKNIHLHDRRGIAFRLGAPKGCRLGHSEKFPKIGAGSTNKVGPVGTFWTHA